MQIHPMFRWCFTYFTSYLIVLMISHDDLDCFEVSYLKFRPLHPSFAIMADRQQSLITTERVKLDGEIPIHQNNLISKVDLSTKLTW